MAQPQSGLALRLPSTAALVWAAVDDWISEHDLALLLADVHPDVDRARRQEALTQILNVLLSEGLLERRPS